MSEEAVYIIEDDLHCEQHGDEFATIEEAMIEIRRLAAIPWSDDPNRAPCMSWRTCGRQWNIIAYDAASVPRVEIRRTAVLEIGAKGAIWLGAAPAGL